MTYEHRVPINFAFGQLDTVGGITATGTSMVSTGFAGKIPTTGLSTTRYVPITLIDELAGVYETVYITAFVSGTNTATIVRGREGSSGRTWAQGSTWVLSPTIRDGNSSLTRATLPSDPHDGMIATLTDENMTVGRTHSQGWLPLLGAGDPRHQGDNQYGVGPGLNHSLEIRAGSKTVTSDGSGFGYFTWPASFTTHCLSVNLTTRNANQFGGWYVVSDLDKDGVSYKVLEPGPTGGFNTVENHSHDLYFIAVGW